MIGECGCDAFSCWLRDAKMTHAEWEAQVAAWPRCVECGSLQIKEGRCLVC